MADQAKKIQIKNAAGAAVYPRTTIDNITRQPQRIGAAVEVDFVQQSRQGVKTTLYVADGIMCHYILLRFECVNRT